MKNNFYVVLPSNSCPLIYPNNKASKFNVQLQNPVYLDGSWEVAMIDFTFVYYPISLYTNARIDYVYKKETKHDVTITVNHKDKTLKVTENPIVTVKDNDILHFQSSYPFEVIFESTDIAHDFGMGFVTVRIDTAQYKTRYWSYKNVENVKNDKNTAKIEQKIEEIFKMKLVCYITRNHTIQIDEPIKNLEDLNKAFKTNCTKVFKSYELQSNKLFTFSLGEHVASVKFDKILVKTLGLDSDEYTLDDDGVIEALVNPKILSYHHQMFIYCNIVEPVIVGDVNVPLLKSVWIEKHEADEVVHITTENPMYLPISTSCINNIEINIRDDSGKLINFPKDSKTHLTLHFRKISDEP